MTEVNKEYLQDLIDDSNKLQALEAAGVDNWEYYSQALTEYNNARDRRIAISKTVAKIIELLTEGAYEPSAHGAGYSFREDAIEEVEIILTNFMEKNK